MHPPHTQRAVNITKLLLCFIIFAVKFYFELVALSLCETLPFVSFVAHATLPLRFASFSSSSSSSSFRYLPFLSLGSSFLSQTNWNNLRQNFLRFVLKVVCDISNGNNNNDGSLRQLPPSPSLSLCHRMHTHLKAVNATAAFNLLQFVLKICWENFLSIMMIKCVCCTLYRTRLHFNIDCANLFESQAETGLEQKELLAHVCVFVALKIY